MTHNDRLAAWEGGGWVSKAPNRQQLNEHKSLTASEELAAHPPPWALREVVIFFDF